jgi:hypothetical protein
LIFGRVELSGESALELEEIVAGIGRSVDQDAGDGSHEARQARLERMQFLGRYAFDAPIGACLRP